MGWRRNRTQWRLELCTCSSLCALLWVVLTGIIRTCIKVRGGCPLPLLLCLQCWIQILFFILLVGMLIVSFSNVVQFLSFFFCLFRAT